MNERTGSRFEVIVTSCGRDKKLNNKDIAGGHILNLKLS